ncbi:sulfur carrier protein ThiS [Hydrogenovibrio kuenenii]|uniref:sulfur carrier protein ThiS n=1 Tax=Hydrogenovibrio kuenenii TaxID=63658 RepID=UPI0004B3DFC1|nr:sulfur carrier protein ThiS [Hydrogenovibrio kuenenii]
MEKQIEVSLNGEPIQCEAGERLSVFLERLGYENTGFAVAMNDTFVPRSQYETQQIESGDQIEVVAPMQGG